MEHAVSSALKRLAQPDATDRELEGSLLQLQAIVNTGSSAAHPASKMYIKIVVTCCRLAGRLQRYEDVVSVADQCLETFE